MAGIFQVLNMLYPQRHMIIYSVFRYLVWEGTEEELMAQTFLMGRKLDTLG